MTDEAMQVAIAEELGWYVGQTTGIVMDIWMHPKHRATHTLPDYLNDLNAMQEVEKVLTQEHYDAYADWLWELVDSGTIAYPNKLIVAMATARQKAEAFLRAIDKWEE